MNVIVYTRPDGGVSVCRPAAGNLEDVMTNDIPADATDVHVLDDSALPDYDEFRNAWRNDGAAVTVDITAAKAIAERLSPSKANEVRAADDVATLRSVLRS